MGKKFDSLNDRLEAFIKQQKIFFVGTACAEGRVNVSPKGLDTFYILNHKEILWLNLTGSGNETAAHMLKEPRMTIMFCSFDRKPLILRLYGQAEVYHERDEAFADYNQHFEDIPGTRQIFRLKIDLVQTSCGFGVPLMDFKGKRETLEQWADQKGEEGVKAYWVEENQKSIDGYDTAIFG